MSTAIERVAPRLPALDRVTPVDQVGVEERVARFCTRSIKKDSKVHALKLALSMIDLTTLEGQDTPGKVTQLCRKASRPWTAADPSWTWNTVSSECSEAIRSGFLVSQPT